MRLLRGYDVENKGKNMFDLTGKNALVTGASGGLGVDIARFLHERGAQLALSGRNGEALGKLCDELGDRACVVVGDLSTAEDAAEIAKKANDEMGGIDILVNNAGLTRDMLALRMKDEDWLHVLDVNLTAAFRLSKAVMRGMMRKRAGRIINITSIVGVTGNAGQANYAASKAGLIGMTKSLAQELGARGITVNAIAPGFIISPMTDALTDAQKKAILDKIPTKRMGDAKDVAAAVGFLASDEASYITGQTLHVNGGMAMF